MDRLLSGFATMREEVIDEAGESDEHADPIHGAIAPGIHDYPQYHRPEATSRVIQQEEG